MAKKDNNNLIISIIIIVAVLIILGIFGFGGYGMMGGYNGYGMMGGYGLGIFGWLMGILFIALILAVIYWLIKSANRK